MCHGASTQPAENSLLGLMGPWVWLVSDWQAEEKLPMLAEMSSERPLLTTLERHIHRQLILSVSLAHCALGPALGVLSRVACGCPRNSRLCGNNDLPAEGTRILAPCVFGISLGAGRSQGRMQGKCGGKHSLWLRVVLWLSLGCSGQAVRSRNLRLL